MEFQIGDVVNRTFGALTRNFVPFFVLSVILVGVPTLLVGLAQFSMNDYSAGFFVLWFLALLVSVATAYILQGALIHGAIMDFNGSRASISSCLSTGLRHALPLFVIAILMSLGVMLGTMLLIIPGIILAIMWIVAVPARVIENVGIFESFSRSRELTKGSRWQVFGLIVIYVIISTVISMVVMIPAGIFGYTAGTDPEAAAFAAGGTSIAIVFLNGLVTVLSAMVSATGVAAIYYELRKDKEGVGAEALAKIFE